MDIEPEKLIRMIELRRLSAVMLTRVLLEYCETDRDTLTRLLAAVVPEELERVYDVLTMYPTTELGWSILPDERAKFFKPELSRAEEADLEGRQFKEDRNDVEYLRQLIRPRC